MMKVVCKKRKKANLELFRLHDLQSKIPTAFELTLKFSYLITQLMVQLHLNM